MQPIAEELINRLLKSAGLSKLKKVTPLIGGANNRVFRVDSESGSVVLKWYFHHPYDQRDRLGAEYALMEFACNHGLHETPRPIACDTEHRLGLYEFIDGKPLAESQVTANRVAEAAQFVRRLNRFRCAPDARQLPNASEACFSIHEHLHCAKRRCEALKECADEVVRRDETSDNDPVSREIAGFILTGLAPRLNDLEQKVMDEARRERIDPSGVLPQDKRRISPSDFGFHNALLESTGKLRFLDFEYAGWDDPAKLVCDFFCQVQTPAPLDHWSDFISAIEIDPEERLLRRCELLLDVYRLKWCCILLNDFLPVGRARRTFSQASQTGEAEGLYQRLQAQLEKARRMLRWPCDS